MNILIMFEITLSCMSLILKKAFQTRLKSPRIFTANDLACQDRLLHMHIKNTCSFHTSKQEKLT